MKLFMIRWPDGTTSFVGAPTKNEAMHFADCEWGDPYDGAEITELKRFAIDLTPKIVDGHLDFDANTGPFGGADEYHAIHDIAYPLIEELRSSETEDGMSFYELEPEEQQGPMEKALAEEIERVSAEDDDHLKTPLEQVMGWAAGSPIAETYGIHDTKDKSGVLVVPGPKLVQ